MNAKQFVSSVVFSGVDWGVAKVPVVGSVIAIPMRIAFPTMGYERVNSTAMRPSTFFSVFFIGFFICFVMQAYFAFDANLFGKLDLNFGSTGGAPIALDRVMFIDDIHNMFNFALLVPLYLVAGTGFMISLFSLKERMAAVGGGYGFTLDDSVRPLMSGVLAVGVLIAVVIIVQAQYAVDVHENSMHLFWFHGSATGSSLNYNGYAYLIINTFLCTFVVLVALLHIELFRWSYILSHSIRSFAVEDVRRENVFENDGNRLKELLSPFTETAIWSKGFAMLLAINLYTWKASGVSGGSVDSTVAGVDDNSLFFRLAFVIYVLLVLWIVSLPRYRIQYELFKLRRNSGVHEYFDIRMPWTVGWSVFIDFLLITFFATAIFGKGSDIFHVITTLFDG